MEIKDNAWCVKVGADIQEWLEFSRAIDASDEDVTRAFVELAGSEIVSPSQRHGAVLDEFLARQFVENKLFDRSNVPPQSMKGCAMPEFYGDSIAYQLRGMLYYTRPALVTDAEVDMAFEELAISEYVKVTARHDDTGETEFVVPDAKRALAFLNAKLAYLNDRKI